MEKFLKRLHRFQFPLISLALAILAYGLFIPWLGFYWDDWPLVWNAHQFGAQVHQGLAAFRPASGWIYYFSFLFLGESPLAWQLYALLWRWLSALAFWWLLRLLWPRSGRVVTAAALLFLLYPGFSQQSISVTYSVYFLYYMLFLLSLCMMLLGLRAKRRKTLYVCGSIVLGLISMLSTEYFYGLELLRPVLIWITLGGKNGASSRKRDGELLLSARNGLKEWLPYAALVPLVFAWRYWASQQAGAQYGASLLGAIAANPFAATLEWLQTALIDLVEGGVLAWGRVAEVWGQLQAGSRVALLYVPVLLAAAGVAAYLLWREAAEVKHEHRAARQALGLGAAALAVSGISFWIAELPMRLAFPFDRFTLPMMFGASLLLGGAWTLVRLPHWVKVGALAVLLGLSIGFHFLMANEYRVEWEQQAEFFKQLAWRAPGLEPGTAIITPELTALEHYTDNSLTAPLNRMYEDARPREQLTYAFFYADLRAGSGLARLGEGGTIEQGYDFVRYYGSAENVVLIIYKPPGCLKVLDPRTDGHYPQLSGEVADLLQLSNPELIQSGPDLIGERMPFWSVEPDESWCYYFERAELARQLGDWELVAQLGDIAFALEDAPNHPSERAPFIEGYAMVGQVDKALELTEEALEINPLMRAMLCDLWLRIGNESAVQEAAIAEASVLLSCN